MAADKMTQKNLDLLMQPGWEGWGKGPDECPNAEKWLYEQLKFHDDDDSNRLDKTARYVMRQMLPDRTIRMQLEGALRHFCSMPVPAREEGEGDRAFEERVNGDIERLVLGGEGGGNEYALATAAEWEGYWKVFGVLEGVDVGGERMDGGCGDPESDRVRRHKALMAQQVPARGSEPLEDEDEYLEGLIREMASADMEDAQAASSSRTKAQQFLDNMKSLAIYYMAERFFSDSDSEESADLEDD